jgi:hypothetical protein
MSKQLIRCVLSIRPRQQLIDTAAGSVLHPAEASQNLNGRQI